MRQINVVVQTSLDGYVAGVKGEFEHFIGGEENLGFVCSIIDESDAIMFGRKSFELLNADWPTAGSKPGATNNVIKYSNWYNAASKTVVSRTLNSTDGMQVLHEIQPSEINNMKQGAGKNILIFGSPTLVHELLNVDLIDNIWLIVHPVIFGDGIPFLRKGDKVIGLDLLSTVHLSNGTLCSKYSVVK